MRICVFGLWHLGSVTAACLSEHFQVIGCDYDGDEILRLANGQAPVDEPGLSDLIRKGMLAERLEFTSDIANAATNADIIWITFDTPVDSDDVADVEFVWRRATSLTPHLRDGQLVVISSQVPVGFTRRLENAFHSSRPGLQIGVAYSPENLRLGKALDVFRKPERIVAGVNDDASRDKLTFLFRPFCERIEWMSIESAEMTKHAINAFLATSVVFINEIAGICEKVGANAKEVERGLKSEGRIGPKAYLSPGGAFAGGTLARDISTLSEVGEREHVNATLISAVRASNDEHKKWALNRLRELLGSVSGTTIAILGLTYKPGTDTLRRSASVELCLALAREGASVRTYDPVVRQIPSELQCVTRYGDVDAALDRADALVVATEWPQFKLLSADVLCQKMRRPVVIDANRFLGEQLGSDLRIQYVAVGSPGKVR